MLEDQLYDLQEASDHRFLVYSSANSYVTPYSSDNHGGELVTEFNQRAALNTLLKREVNLAAYSDLVVESIANAFGDLVEVNSMTGATEKVGPGLCSFLDSTLHSRDNWHVTAFATGARDEGDFALAISGSRLTIASGHALLCGYYFDAAAEVQIALSDVVQRSEVQSVIDNPGQTASHPCLTKFVKLAVQYTAPDEESHSDRLITPTGEVYQHDERLVEPNGSWYPAIVVLVNGELPATNELLLGTITCDSQGTCIVVNNPYKTRMVPLDSVDGAEDYSRLLSAIEDSSTYGVKFGSTEGSEDGSVTNLRKIDQWLWLDFSSNLGLLLRSMSTNAETAGNATDEPTRGIIVSDETPYTGDDAVVDNFNCLQRVDARTGTQFARMSWHQAQTPPKTGADRIDHRALYFQYAKSQKGGSFIAEHELKAPYSDASVQKPFYDITSYPSLNGLNGTDGIMTYQQLAMLELVFKDYTRRQSTGEPVTGTMFGPFLTLADAKSWFQSHRPVIGVGDYFWVINDTAEAGGTEAAFDAESETYSLHNIVTNYGTMTGVVTGTAKQSSLIVPVQATGTGTASKVGEPDVEYEFENIDITGEGKGTINATVKGTVSGTLTSFVQNVSSRYVCRYRAAVTESDEDGTWKFAHGVMINPEHDPDYPDDPYKFKDVTLQDYIILDGDGQSQSFADASASEYDTHVKQDVLFAVESVERGFAVPATPNVYGVSKVGTGSNLYDVIIDATTQRLRITDSLLGFIKGGGFQDQVNASAEISISPNDDLTQYRYMRFPNGVTFVMSGKASEWRAALDTTGTLSHIRGDIKLDFSQVEEDGVRSDGLLLRLEDIDFLTLVGDNQATDGTAGTTIHASTETLLFGVNHCTVNSPFFTNIGEWKYSQFISGGNSLELDLPWMQVTDVFTNTAENSLSCKFTSVTMGETGLVSAMMDIWVKHEGWSDYSGGIDKMWASSGYIKFPPMFFEPNVDSSGSRTAGINMHTIQRIPDNLNLKISGTAGIHQAWDDNNTEFVPGGNLLVNLNWEYNGNPSSAKTPGGRLYLNLYMKNASADDMKQNFSNLRFRAAVQVIRLDDNSMSNVVPYEQLYETIPTEL